MKRTRHSAEQIVAELREADAMLAARRSIALVVQALGVSEQTFHRWRRQYGGMRADEARRLKELEIENARLKRLVGGPGVAAGPFTFPCAAVLLAFMVPATFYIHGYWRYSGEAREQHFNGRSRNLTVSGGLVLLLATGPGARSVDALIAGGGSTP